MRHVLLLAFLSSVSGLGSFNSHAASSQHMIQGFRFATCDAKQCVEASSAKAWLSQIDGGFSSDGPTQIVLRKATGELVQEFTGTEASYSPTVQVITLEFEEGGSLFISLRDGSVRRFEPSKIGGEK